MVDWKSKNVIVTGGAGFLGSYLCKVLKDRGCESIFVPRSFEYDLRFERDIDKMFSNGETIDYLFNLAANVGGIGYNKNHPYYLFYDNIKLGTELIHQSIFNGVKKFVQIGTVCAYPKWCNVPFSEKSLWDGYPEETNAPYGLAKKMLLVQLQAARNEFGFNGIYILPTNLYGPGDEFNPSKSHVIPALIRKSLEAKEKGSGIEVWGSGEASRDFLYVEDAAIGIVKAAEKYERGEPINLGSGKEVKIATLLYLISEIIDYRAKIKWDISKPDGQPRRLLDIRDTKQILDWQPEISLSQGLKQTIEWYKMKERVIA